MPELYALQSMNANKYRTCFLTAYEPVCCGPEVMRTAGWTGGENAVY